LHSAGSCKGEATFFVQPMLQLDLSYWSDELMQGPRTLLFSHVVLLKPIILSLYLFVCYKGHSRSLPRLMEFERPCNSHILYNHPFVLRVTKHSIRVFSLPFLSTVLVEPSHSFSLIYSFVLLVSSHEVSTYHQIINWFKSKQCVLPFSQLPL
jgi:hypothetical protein